MKAANARLRFSHHCSEISDKNGNEIIPRMEISSKYTACYLL